MCAAYVCVRVWSLVLGAIPSDLWPKDFAMYLCMHQLLLTLLFLKLLLADALLLIVNTDVC